MDFLVSGLEYVCRTYANATTKMMALAIRQAVMKNNMTGVVFRIGDVNVRVSCPVASAL